MCVNLTITFVYETHLWSPYVIKSQFYNLTCLTYVFSKCSASGESRPGVGSYHTLQYRECQNIFTCLKTQIFNDNRWISPKSGYLNCRPSKQLFLLLNYADLSGNHHSLTLSLPAYTQCLNLLTCS